MNADQTFLTKREDQPRKASTTVMRPEGARHPVIGPFTDRQALPAPFASAAQVKSAARAVLASLTLLAAGCASLPSVSKDFGAPIKVGRTSGSLEELSGLAASQRADQVLWGLNDSGADPEFEAIHPSGTRIGQVRLVGVVNRDWEAMASFMLDGKPWLLIADVGDNNGVRHDCVLHIVEEPRLEELRPEKTLKVSPAWSIPVSYEDGPRDCESVAVDAKEGRVYLLSKRTNPPMLYWLPLRPAPGESPVARKLGPAVGIPAATEAQKLIPAPTGRYRPSPTGMDFSPDGMQAALLTYGDVWLYRRAPGQSWTEAFGAQPRRLEAHGLMQAEAISFSRDGRSLYVGSEGEGSSLLRYDAR